MHPKIEANHELRSELDCLTSGMAEQLEGTPVDQRKAMVDTVIAQWVKSLTPERFISTDPLQAQRDAYRTIQEGVRDAEKKYPQLVDSQLGYDLGDIVFDMVETLAGMPARERGRLVDAAITEWLEALPVEILRELDEGKIVQPVFGETLEFPEFLSAFPSEIEINRSLGIVPLAELLARTEAITPEQVLKKPPCHQRKTPPP